MATRRKTRRRNPAVFSPLILALLVVGWGLTHVHAFLFYLLFAAIVAACVYIALKLYPRWAEIRRFRALRLDDVDNMPGHMFEHYIARLMEYQGFKTVVTKGSGDLGIDVVAHKAGVGYAVQCKRYSDNIPRNAVSDAVAGKQYYGCAEAMVVTNRCFTPGAIELAKSTRCILIDRNGLAAWVNSFQRQNTANQLRQGPGRV